MTTTERPHRPGDSRLSARHQGATRDTGQALAAGWKRLATIVGPSGVRPHYCRFLFTIGRDNIPYWQIIDVEVWIGNPGQTTALLTSYFRTTPVLDAPTANSYGGTQIRLTHDPATDTCAVEFNLTDTGGPAYVLSYDADNQSASTTVAYVQGALPGGVAVATHTVNDNVTRTSRNGTLVTGDIPTVIDDLDDVDTTTTVPVQGDGLVWNGAGQWVPTAVGAGVSYMDDLLDADTTTTPPAAGDALIWDGAGNWTPGGLLSQFLTGTLTVGWRSICQIPASGYSFGKFWLGNHWDASNEGAAVLVEWWNGSAALVDTGPVGSFLRTTPTVQAGTAGPAITDVRMTMDPTTNTIDIEFYAQAAWTWYLEYSPADQDVTVDYVEGPANAANTVIVCSHKVDDNITRTCHNGVADAPATLYIDELGDVDTSTTAPTEGQTLVWDPAALPAPGQWVPATITTGVSQITGTEVNTGWREVMRAGGITVGQRFGRFWIHIGRASDTHYWQSILVEWSANFQTTTADPAGSWLHVVPVAASESTFLPPIRNLRAYTDDANITHIDVNDVDTTDHEYAVSWAAAEQSPDVLMSWAAVTATVPAAGVVNVAIDFTNREVTYVNGVLVSADKAELDSYARMIRHRSQLISGGTLSFRNGDVKWSDDFIVIGVGESPELVQGHNRIAMPASGAVVTGAFGHADVTVTADGIPLEDFESIYAVPNPAGSATTELRIFAYSGGSGNTVPADRVPVDWIWICTRDGDSDSVWWGNGGAVSNGQAQVYPRPQAGRRLAGVYGTTARWVRIAKSTNTRPHFGRFYISGVHDVNNRAHAVTVEWMVGSLYSGQARGTWLHTEPTQGAAYVFTAVRLTQISNALYVEVHVAATDGGSYEIGWDPDDQSDLVEMAWAGQDTTATQLVRHEVNDNTGRTSRNGVLDPVLANSERHIRFRHQVLPPGTVTVANNAVKWTGQWTIIGGGDGTEVANGYCAITMPPSGTVITGAFGTPNVTVTADGIPMLEGSNDWLSLYYVLDSTTYATSKFRVMVWDAANAIIPANWLWLCTRDLVADRFVFPQGGAIPQGGGSWTPGVAATPVTDLDGLSDVDTSTVAPASGEVLTWDSGNALWKPNKVIGRGAGSWTLDPHVGTIFNDQAKVVFNDYVVTWHVMVTLGSGNPENTWITVLPANLLPAGLRPSVNLEHLTPGNYAGGNADNVGFRTSLLPSGELKIFKPPDGIGFTADTVCQFDFVYPRQPGATA